MQTIEQFDALRTESGAGLLRRIGEELASGRSELQIATRLRTGYPGDLVAAAMTLVDVRARAAGKFSRAAEMWLTRAGFEQASSEAIARHRASRFAASGKMADLCCGIGGDLIGLAALTQVLAIDRDPLHLACAQANANVYGVGDRVTAREADVRSLNFGEVEAVFIDPARRGDSGRFSASRTEPPLDWVFGLEELVPAIGMKAAPGIDLALVPVGWEVEFIAEGRALKEAAFWSPPLATAARRATIVPNGRSFVAVPGDPVEINPPGAYLLDPNPAITRAGLVQDLARTLGAWQIDPEIAFLSCDRIVETPWARSLRVIDSMPWRIKSISAALRSHGIGAVDIRRRGLAGDVEEIRRQLKLSGSGRATVAMTRYRNQPWCVIAVDS